MARLFVGQREIDFITDLTKEFIKDVAGQVIHYYPISSIKSFVHGVYNESVSKIFENPIILPALVSPPEFTSRTTNFGPDMEAKIEVLVHYTDLQDKNITLSEGDLFSYGVTLYEVQTLINSEKNVFGLAEHNVAWKVTGRTARISTGTIPSLNVPRTAPDGTQTVFEQQRGLPIMSDGQNTEDFRHMRDRLGDQMAPVALGTGAKKVEPVNDDDGIGDELDTASAFNNAPLPPRLGIYDE